MNLVEAAKKAALTSGKIYRSKWRGKIQIEPTNTYRGCVCIEENRIPHNGWRPKAEDLMANDWNVLSD